MAGWLAAMGQSAGNAAAAGAGNSVGQFAGDFSDWMTDKATFGLWGKYQDSQWNKERNRQKLLNEDAAMINFKYGEQAADAAMKRAEAMYNKYESYGAQRAQMEAAGLNPALMYGMGGSVGQSVGSGAQGGGASGSAEPMNQASMMMAAAEQRSVSLEQQMIAAQIRNIDADTKMKETGAGVNETTIEKMGVEMAAIVENVENTKVVRESYRLDNEYKRIQNEVSKATKESAKQIIHQEAYNLWQNGQKLIAETMSAEAKGQVDKATVDTMIKTASAQLENIMADTYYKITGAKLNAENQKFVGMFAEAAMLSAAAQDAEVGNSRERAAALRSQAETAKKNAETNAKDQKARELIGYLNAAIDQQDVWAKLVDGIIPL